MQFLPQLIAAMVMVESGPSSPGGYAGQAALVGDGGRAFGCLQIHASVIKDVNRIYGVTYNHNDAFDPAKAVQICRLYLKAYAPPGASPEICARIWNGGPRGHMKASTVPYWERVRKKFIR
ncbi:MAG: hypothetical protein NT011_13590 [Kiritimatiellaeota bacterium]|nr:hypothetical protein [Kiritimatiellota bacterium]